jgi:hypothetical protein
MVKPVWVEPTEEGILGGFQFVELAEEAQERIAAYLKSDLERRVIKACEESTHTDLERRLIKILEERRAIGK